MYDEVLVPLSGGPSDERVVAHAVAMAKLTGAHAHLVQVLEISPGGARERPVDPVEWHVRKLEAEAYLDGVAERFRAGGIEVAEVLLEGQASEHLINYAHNAHAELVVMAGNHSGGTVGALGSELLWRSFVSTLLVRPSRISYTTETAESHDWSDDDGPDDENDERFLGSGAPASRTSEEHIWLHRAALTRITVSRWRPRTMAPTSVTVGVGRAPALKHQQLSGEGLAAAGATSLRGVAPAAGWTSPEAGVKPSTTESAPGATRLLPPDPAARIHYVSSQLSAKEDSAQDRKDKENDVDGFRFRRMLVALDGSKRSECVLSWVRLIAEKHGTQVVLVHVVADPELPRITPASQEDIGLARQLQERNRAEAEAYLKDAQSRLGVESETRLEVGHRVATKLHDIVASEQIDLVVMSAHGYGGESRWPFGDVATNFIGYSRTALLIVQDMPRPPEARLRGDVTTERWGG